MISFIKHLQAFLQEMQNSYLLEHITMAATIFSKYVKVYLNKTLQGRGVFRTFTASDMKFFMTLANGFQPLTKFRKKSILDVTSLL